MHQPRRSRIERAHDVALDQFKAGNYPAAIASFNAFVKNYAKSPLAPSAYYWIGNSQFALKDYRAAIATQRQMVAAFPTNPKVPDALLNIATSQFELNDAAASRRTLRTDRQEAPAVEAPPRRGNVRNSLTDERPPTLLAPARSLPQGRTGCCRAAGGATLMRSKAFAARLVACSARWSPRPSLAERAIRIGCGSRRSCCSRR